MIDGVFLFGELFCFGQLYYMNYSFGFYIGISWVFAVIFAVAMLVGTVSFLTDNKKAAYRAFKVAAIVLLLTIITAYSSENATRIIFF